MDTMRLTDVLWVSLAAFAGFEIALAANYLLLKFLLRVMRFGLERKGSREKAPALR